jgi:hypothetical protein
MNILLNDCLLYRKTYVTWNLDLQILFYSDSGMMKI